VQKQNPPLSGFDNRRAVCENATAREAIRQVVQPVGECSEHSPTICSTSSISDFSRDFNNPPPSLARSPTW